MNSLFFLQKVFVSIAIGALIGLEREYSAKQEFAGMRTFSLISFLGMLSVFLSDYTGAVIVPISFLAVILFILFFKFFAKGIPFGLTTLFSMVLSFLFGSMVGFGLFFEAIAASLITVTILLGRKKLHAFVKHRTHEELVDVVEFAIIAFVIYPILPPQPVSILFLNFDLHLLWYTIVIVCLLSFLSFLATKRLGDVGILASTFFGSLLSSTLTIAELTKISQKLGEENLLNAFNVALITMFTRNFLLVALITPSLAVPIAIFTSILLFFIFKNTISFKLKTEIKFREHKPFSVGFAVKVSVFLIFLSTILDILKGNIVGTVLTSIIGGMVSSASTVASLLFSFQSGVINYQLTKLSVCLAVLSTCISDLLVVNAFGSETFKKDAFRIVSKLIVVGLIVSILLFFINI